MCADDRRVALALVQYGGPSDESGSRAFRRVASEWEVIRTHTGYIVKRRVVDECGIGKRAALFPPRKTAEKWKVTRHTVSSVD